MATCIGAAVALPDSLDRKATLTPLVDVRRPAWAGMLYRSAAQRACLDKLRYRPSVTAIGNVFVAAVPEANVRHCTRARGFCLDGSWVVQYIHFNSRIWFRPSKCRALLRSAFCIVAQAARPGSDVDARRRADNQASKSVMR